MISYGMQVGLGTVGMEFDPTRPYTGCRICGRVYQSDLDRLPYPSYDDFEDALALRRSWSKSHARTHPEHQHQSLQASGRWATPDAALKLAAFGVIPVIDLVMDEEVAHALRESKPIPADDVDGS